MTQTAPSGSTTASPTRRSVVLPRHDQTFPTLTQAEIARVRRFGEARRYRDGDLLFETGKRGPGMFVVLAGHVAISKRDGFGNVTPVTDQGPGQFVAEIGQLSGRAALIDGHAGPLVSIIDDDDDVRQSLQALVESVGYAAQVFDSAEAFLQSDAPTKARCIISDVQMAQMSGIELAAHLARTGCRTPIILISAFAKDHLLRTLDQPAVVAILSKPLQPNALIDELGRALNT